MKAAVWTDYGKLEIQEVPVPEIGESEVLIQVMAAGVCITDLHVYTGQFAYGAPPHILGHEIAGRIVKTGGAVDSFFPGDRVVVETSIGCGRCKACRTGNRHLCAEMTEIGFTPHAGGYAQYVKAPATNLFRIPANVSYEEAGIVESVVCPSGALMRWGVRFGETVAVYGVGPAGLAFIQTAKAMGAGKVIAVARDPFRLERARRFGADVILNAKTEDVPARLLEETAGEGPGLVCEAAGAPATILQSIEIAARGGRVILYGIPGDKDRFDFPVSQIITKQLEIYGAVGNPQVWEPLLQLVSAGRINLRDMVTHTFPLERINDAFALISDKTENPIKAVLYPNGKDW
ncbi:MAG: zinc-dependent alcohol dehydrogenase [Candidatus Merdivicinus sp.]|jgi:threonine dehydrogenase-like Zn-dependent dehydrogenase